LSPNTKEEGTDSYLLEATENEETQKKGSNGTSLSQFIMRFKEEKQVQFWQAVFLLCTPLHQRAFKTGMEDFPSPAFISSSVFGREGKCGGKMQQSARW
jgi:hypothetical protein